MPTITINSILGGHAPLSHFANKDQFRSSIGIDPAQPIDDSDNNFATIGSGYIRPSASQKFSGTTITSAPMFILPNPKDAFTYVIDANGSMYTVATDFATVTALSDGGTLSSGVGNGAAYYDNYIYIAKNTDIARYGPLNGVAAFNGSYWVGTLGKSALTNTTYPTDFLLGMLYPNHPMLRHSDGNLYIGDVVANVGTIHLLSTKKTAVEGDTDNGSVYNKLKLGTGIWPVAIETYETSIAIACIEVSGSTKRDMRAKVAFWDTNSPLATDPQNTNKITWVEFPDQLITAMKNCNGVLRVVSGNYNVRGFRISEFSGGYTFTQKFYSEQGQPPFIGAVDGQNTQLLIGGNSTVPATDGCVYSYGLQNGLSQGLFNIYRTTGGVASTLVTSLSLAQNNELGFDVPIVGWTNGPGSSTHGLDKQGTTYNNGSGSIWWSQVYRIGEWFNIRSLTIPLAGAVASGTTVTPTIYVDDGSTSYTVSIINSTIYSGSDRHIKIPMTGIVGENHFWLELKFTGSSVMTVGLPITMEVDYDD